MEATTDGKTSDSSDIIGSQNENETGSAFVNSSAKINFENRHWRRKDNDYFENQDNDDDDDVFFCVSWTSMAKKDIDFYFF